MSRIPCPVPDCPQPESIPEATWTVAVQVPISLPVEVRHDLFSAVAAAVTGWEPGDRDGWDADVSGYPTTTFDRCPSCDHLASMHQPDGCWHTVTHGTENQNKVCPCSTPRTTFNQPQEV